MSDANYSFLMLYGQVRSSVKLKRVIQTILSLGNALNQGTARGKSVSEPTAISIFTVQINKK